jgi:hypothetical protein
MNLRPFDQNPQFTDELARSAKTRFARRSISAKEESIDADVYFITDVQRRLAILRDGISGLEISPQIQDEIKTNVGKVESELDGAIRSADDLELLDSMGRIASFFWALEKGLIDGKLCSPKSDFVYAVRRVSDMCREGAVYGLAGRAHRHA